MDRPNPLLYKDLRRIGAPAKIYVKVKGGEARAVGITLLPTPRSVFERHTQPVKL